MRQFLYNCIICQQKISLLSRSWEWEEYYYSNCRNKWSVTKMVTACFKNNKSCHLCRYSGNDFQVLKTALVSGCFHLICAHLSSVVFDRVDIWQIMYVYIFRTSKCKHFLQRVIWDLNKKKRTTRYIIMTTNAVIKSPFYLNSLMTPPLGSNEWTKWVTFFLQKFWFLFLLCTMTCNFLCNRENKTSL